MATTHAAVPGDEEEEQRRRVEGPAEGEQEEVDGLAQEWGPLRRGSGRTGACLCVLRCATHAGHRGGCGAAPPADAGPREAHLLALLRVLPQQGGPQGPRSGEQRAEKQGEETARPKLGEFGNDKVSGAPGENRSQVRGRACTEGDSSSACSHGMLPQTPKLPLMSAEHFSAAGMRGGCEFERRATKRACRPIPAMGRWKWTRRIHRQTGLREETVSQENKGPCAAGARKRIKYAPVHPHLQGEDGVDEE